MSLLHKFHSVKAPKFTQKQRQTHLLATHLKLLKLFCESVEVLACTCDSIPVLHILLFDACLQLDFKPPREPFLGFPE